MRCGGVRVRMEGVGERAWRSEVWRSEGEDGGCGREGMEE